MEIIIGKTSGFCKGVEHTVREASKILEKEKVYCLGEIVHNERVVTDLKNLGMITINNISDAKKNSKVIVRAHGEVKETYEIAKEKNIELLDLTCGKIKAIKVKIEKHKNDSFIIIIGKKSHPESIGLKSFANNNSCIIENEEDIEKSLDLINKSNLNKIYIISQTTFNSSKFAKLTNIIKENTNKDVIIDKTICDATSKRQEETEILSKKVDVMLIVGGKHSSNTKELENVSKTHCKKTYLLQNKDDLKDIKISSKNKIGIMAGASTPKIIVEEIINKLKEDYKN